MSASVEESQARERFRAVDPCEFVLTHWQAGRHTDLPVRALHQLRDTQLQMHVLTAANGSAMCKLGGTTVVCGVKAELQSTPGVTVRLDTHSCGPLPSHLHNQVTQASSLLNDLARQGHLLEDIDDQLSIASGKLAWILYCDVHFLKIDGAVLDAALLCLVAALRHTRLPDIRLQLPAVTQPSQAESSQEDSMDSTAVDPTSHDHVLQRALATQINAVPLGKLPVKVDSTRRRQSPLRVTVLHAVTFTAHDQQQLVVDPNAEELAHAGNSTAVVSGPGQQLYGLHSGGAVWPLPLLQQATALTQQRHAKVQHMLEQAEALAAEKQ